MITATLLAAGLMTATDGSSSDLSVAVNPAHVELNDLQPGRPASAQVEVVNNGRLGAILSVRGDLDAPAGTADTDLLKVDLHGCSQPWVGLPDAPTCPAPTGVTDLAAVPLSVGERTWVLITAGLDASAGNGAQGQTWTAHTTLTAAASSPAPALAHTGTDPVGALVIGGAAVALGLGLRRAASAYRLERRPR